MVPPSIKWLSAVLLLIASSSCIDVSSDELDGELEDLDAEAIDSPVGEARPAALVDADDPSATACVSSCQCSPGQACFAGFCQTVDFSPVPQCVSGCQCGYGGQCVDGSCTQPSACSSDCDCGQGMVCGMNGQCTPDFGPYPTCHCDAECASNEACIGGHCMVTGGGGGGGGGADDGQVEN